MATPGTQRPNEKDRSAPSGTPRVRVLVLDSNARSCDALVRLLRRARVDALGVLSVGECQRELRRKSFDILLLDLDTPGGRWREVARRAASSEKETPRLLGMSARGRHWAGQEPIEDCLTKPVRFGRLLELVGAPQGDDPE